MFVCVHVCVYVFGWGVHLHMFLCIGTGLDSSYSLILLLPTSLYVTRPSAPLSLYNLYGQSSGPPQAVSHTPTVTHTTTCPDIQVDPRPLT